METHPIAKGFEDQKFSYLVLRRGDRPGKHQDDSSEPLSLQDQSFAWPRMDDDIDDIMMMSLKLGDEVELIPRVR